MKIVHFSLFVMAMAMAGMLNVFSATENTAIQKRDKAIISISIGLNNCTCIAQSTTYKNPSKLRDKKKHYTHIIESFSFSNGLDEPSYCLLEKFYLFLSTENKTDFESDILKIKNYITKLPPLQFDNSKLLI